MLDHRYFYIEDGYGRYTCGLARQGVIDFIRMYAEESIFLGSEWYLALTAFKNNPSVIGFTVEQMIISRIASIGLKLGRNNSIPVVFILAFLESVAGLLKGKPSILYVPIKFNLKVIDALYVAADTAKEIAQIIAIQITVVKWHKDFATVFFADWDQWIKLLHGFTVEATFLWIVKDKQGMEQMEQTLIKLRTQTIITSRPYSVFWVTVDQVNKDLGSMLKSIHLIEDGWTEEQEQ